MPLETEREAVDPFCGGCLYALCFFFVVIRTGLEPRITALKGRISDRLDERTI